MMRTADQRVVLLATAGRAVAWWQPLGLSEHVGFWEAVAFHRTGARE